MYIIIRCLFLVASHMGFLRVRLGRAAFKRVCFWTFPFLRNLWIGRGDEDSVEQDAWSTI